jgi:RimJ/RimL family protein N-acetyltransferase
MSEMPTPYQPELTRSIEPIVIETDQPGLAVVQMTSIEDDIEYLKFQTENFDHIDDFGNVVYDDLQAITKRRTDPDNFRFGIRKDGNLVGLIGYEVSPDDREVEVGIMLAKAHKKHGYATSALKAVSDYTAQRFDRVFAEVDRGHDESIRMCGRAGYALQPYTVWRDEKEYLVFDYNSDQTQAA